MVDFGPVLHHTIILPAAIYALLHGLYHSLPRLFPEPVRKKTTEEDQMKDWAEPDFIDFYALLSLQNRTPEAVEEKCLEVSANSTFFNLSAERISAMRDACEVLHWTPGRKEMYDNRLCAREVYERDSYRLNGERLDEESKILAAERDQAMLDRDIAIRMKELAELNNTMFGFSWSKSTQLNWTSGYLHHLVSETSMLHKILSIPPFAIGVFVFLVIFSFCALLFRKKLTIKKLMLEQQPNVLPTDVPDPFLAARLKQRLYDKRDGSNNRKPTFQSKKPNLPFRPFRPLPPSDVVDHVRFSEATGPKVLQPPNFAQQTTASLYPQIIISGSPTEMQGPGTSGEFERGDGMQDPLSVLPVTTPSSSGTNTPKPFKHWYIPPKPNSPNKLKPPNFVPTSSPQGIPTSVPGKGKTAVRSAQPTEVQRKYSIMIKGKSI